MNVSTFGFTVQQWDEAKQEGTQILIERAKLRGMIPYSELVKHIKAVQLEAHDVRLDHLLGEISQKAKHCRTLRKKPVKAVSSRKATI
jgi:hypothetical protein